jgi:hypothetical protein
MLPKESSLGLSAKAIFVEAAWTVGFCSCLASIFWWAWFGESRLFRKFGQF